MPSEPNHPRRPPFSAPSTSALGRLERLPPALLMLYFGLAAITIMFAMLVASYAYNRLGGSTVRGLHPFPRYFSLSTLVLLASSYTVAQSRRLYLADDVAALVRGLGATLLLACIFAGLQVLGWRELQQQGIFFSGEAGGTYVYLISALHVAHLLGGMLFLLVLLLRALAAARDAVRGLVFIRDPYQLRQLRLLSTYWHFIDVLWILLFIVFLCLY